MSKRQGRAYGSALTGVMIAASLVGGCTVGPDYQRPDAKTQYIFKEAGDEWREADPNDAIDRGEWWKIYHDAVLDDLESQVATANQTLAQQEAAYRNSVALVNEAAAQFYPTVSANTSVNRSGNGGGTGGSSSIISNGNIGNIGNTGTGTTGTNTTPTRVSVGRGSSSTTEYSGQLSASWAPDLFGRIRRTAEADIDTAEASAANVASARLLAQSTLASDYFQLRGADQLKTLLDDTVTAFTRSLKITRDQYNAGTAQKSDVITALTQLESAQAQDINAGVQRATLEHAIAVLVGKTPAELSIEPASLTDIVPVTPPGIATKLLERRPDIAIAERQVASANAQIGVAIAAYYPDLTLTGSYGFDSTMFSTLFRAASSFWSVGGSLSETIFDAGARDAAVDAARATYQQQVANYRQTVLTAFQQVEDELATLRILAQQAVVEADTVKQAKLAVDLFLNEYKAGTVAYTSVVMAQSTALTEQESALTILQNRLVASVSLVQALGGGFNADQLPNGDTLDKAYRPADAETAKTDSSG
jgi:NodT family efflux transporter outer membrane factor (OMF) lipoprotein